MSSHFGVQHLAAQDVEVQVGNGLTGVGAAVGDHPVAGVQAPPALPYPGRQGAEYGNGLTFSGFVLIIQKIAEQNSSSGSRNRPAESGIPFPDP